MSDSTENLKKRIVSNGKLSDVDIQKTDSVVNLTQSSLYGIYNQNSELALGNDENDTNDLYVAKTNVEVVSSESQISPFKGFAKLSVLAIGAFFYNEITSYIRNNHIQLDKHAFQPLYLTELLLTSSFKKVRPLAWIGIEADPKINYAIVLYIQGLIMGCFLPLIDFIIPPEYNKRLFSSNPDPKKRNEPVTLFNDILRLIITFLGISYAIRNLEWSSQLQVSVVWSLLSPSLWLILDGTVAGALSGLSMTILGCFFLYISNIDVIQVYSKAYLKPEDFMPILLWASSFFFCGMIIFGKLGRALL